MLLMDLIDNNIDFEDTKVYELTSAIAYAGYFQNINNTGSSVHGVRSDVTSSAAGNVVGLGVSTVSGVFKPEATA